MIVITVNEDHLVASEVLKEWASGTFEELLTVRTEHGNSRRLKGKQYVIQRSRAGSSRSSF